MSAFHIGNVLNLDLVLHYVDMCYIYEHVFDLYNCWFLIIPIFFKELEFLERCTFSVTRKHVWAQQVKVTRMLLCLFMH